MKHRISSAQVSHNLGEVGLEEIGDVDIVRACGMVAGKQPLGMSLWRLKYGGDHREMGPAVAGLVGMMVRRGWHGDEIPALVVAVLRHWLDDVCPSCLGRGYDVMPGSPMLSDQPCDACKGEGRLPLPVRDEPALWLVETIARLEREVAGAIMAKLNSEIDDLLQP